MAGENFDKSIELTHFYDGQHILPNFTSLHTLTKSAKVSFCSAMDQHCWDTGVYTTFRNKKIVIKVHIFLYSHIADFYI